jgi:hypothetical protein
MPLAIVESGVQGEENVERKEREKRGERQDGYVPSHALQTFVCKHFAS